MAAAEIPKSNAFCASLRDAVDAANGIDAYDATVDKRKRWLDAYESYKTSEWAVALNRRLGSSVIARMGRPLRVLDVGCGEHQRFFSSLSLDESRWDYCSVDLSTRPLSFGVHVVGDVFDPETVKKLSGGFDVILIDVEPHGREFELYEALIRAGKLARTHMVVLQCIGHMGTGGAYMADQFMDALSARHRVLSMLATFDLHLTRDVYVVVDIAGDSPALDDVDVFVKRDRRLTGSEWVSYAPDSWGPGIEHIR